MASILNATTTSGLVTSADNSGSLQLQTNNGTTAVTIDTSQNVGIGTTSPSSFFSEARNLVVGTGSGGQGITIFAGNANQSRLMFADGTSGTDPYTGFVQYDHSSNAMTFGTNGGNERMRITSGGDLQFNSGYGSVATAYGCRAWLNVRGDCGINGSGNISSVTDIGASYPTQYLRVSFTTAMPDKNYNIVTGLGGYLKQYGDREASSDTDTSFKQTNYFEVDISGTSANSDIHFAIFR